MTIYIYIDLYIYIYDIYIYILVGGLEHFLFSIVYGIILPIDFHIFQDGYCTTDQYIYIYIHRVKAGGEPSVLTLYRKVVLVYRWVGGGVGGGGVITSCEVRWMMMNAGRCCYVASFVVYS